MAIPSTGTTWKSGNFSAEDSSFLERGGRIAAAVRQARGALTNISPHDSSGANLWSPFALDGALRADLFAFKKVNGYWVLNTNANEGFFPLGAFKEGDGPTTKMSIDDDDFMIEQSNRPYDSDRIKEQETITLTPVDTLRSVIRRVRNGLPLADANGNRLVELPGQPGTTFLTPVDYTPVDYQLLIMREFTKPSGKIQTVKAFDLAKVSNIGDAKMGKKDSEAAELTFKPLPGPFFMGVQDGEYQPIVRAEWIGGVGYSALYGSPTSQYLVTLGTQTSGTFGLGLTTTTDANGIVYNPTSAAVKAALVAVDDGFTASDWTVTGATGGPFTVTTPGGRVLKGTGASLGTPGTFAITPV